MPDPSIPTISVDELARRIDASEDLYLIDVRQPEEEAEGVIPGARLIPLAELPAHVDELPKDREILIHCRSGGRSGKAVGFLQSHGFTNAVNVAGGIQAWNALGR